MKMTSPHSLPDGESSSAGIIVSAAAAKKAACGSVKMSLASVVVCDGPGTRGVDCASAGIGRTGVNPAPATLAALATFKNSRRGMLPFFMLPPNRYRSERKYLLLVAGLYLEKGHAVPA